MRGTNTIRVAVLAITLAGCAIADGREDALAAYERQDYATALRLLKPLADQGNPAAQFNLGFMYANGRGVPKDDAQAVKWYRLAADQGWAPAQVLLGFMYANGLAVPRDYVLAYLWSNLAAAGGDEAGAQNRDMYSTHMTPTAIEEAQRLSREWKPK